MQHSMTVGTNRTQILDWIDLVFHTDLGQRTKVVYVNESFRSQTVNISKIDPADTASSAMNFLAPSNGLKVALV